MCTHTCLKQYNRRDLDSDTRFKEQKDEADLTQSLSNMLVIHKLPAIQLGAGRTTVGHKFQALMHMIKLVAPTLTLLPYCVRRTFALTSDYGVEARVPSVRPVPVSEVFPYLEEDDYSDNDDDSDTDSEMPGLVDPQDDFEKVPEALPAEDDDDFAGIPVGKPRRDHREELLDLTGCSEIPGLLHVIHNAGKGLSNQLDDYKEATEKLQKVSNMLRRKESKERLQESCFDSDTGRAVYEQCLKCFKGHCYQDRWGTVADCLIHMSIDVKAALDFFWDAEKYRGSTSEKTTVSDEEDDHDAKERIDIIDEALRNPFWWAYWHMLMRVAKILRLALIWAEGCPCHDSLRAALLEVDPEVDSDIIKELRDLVNTCVMRGRRCPELAAGDFHRVLKRLYLEEGSQLLMQLPPSLNGEERKRILGDFERSRQYLLATFILKLSHWPEIIHFVYAVAHYDPEVAWSCYQVVMRCSEETELIKELKSPELSQDRLYFESLEGALPVTDDPSDAPLLRQFLAKLQLARSAERVAEGLHAVVHKEVKRCPNHSTALVSLSNRFPQIRTYCAENPSNLNNFALTLSNCVNSRIVCNILGFRNHPTVQLLKASKDHHGYEVVYHADVYSKYKMARPNVNFRTGESVPASGAMLSCFLF